MIWFVIFGVIGLIYVGLMRGCLIGRVKGIRGGVRNMGMKGVLEMWRGGLMVCVSVVLVCI